MAVTRLIGKNGLVAGKKAMKVSGCKHCGAVGKMPLGSVRTVKEFLGIDTIQCSGCFAVFVVTLFKTVEDPGYFITAAWKPMPDVDITREDTTAMRNYLRTNDLTELEKELIK